MSRLGVVLTTLGGLWVLGLILALFNFWPWGTEDGWGWVLLWGPPAALGLELLGELFGEWWGRTELVRAVEERTEGKRFSWLRVALAFLSVALVGALVWAGFLLVAG